MKRILSEVPYDPEDCGRILPPAASGAPIPIAPHILLPARTADEEYRKTEKEFPKETDRT